MNPSVRRGSAFTLLEIIVTITIVTILAALAFPAYQHLASRARGVSCQSNLRHLGAALNLFVGENGGRMPTMTAARANRLEPADPPTLDVVLAPYLSQEDALHCPGDPEHFARSGTSYHWNSLLNGQNTFDLRFLMVDNESGIPVFADKEAFHQGLGDEVNILYADGRVEKEVRFWVDGNGAGLSVSLEQSGKDFSP